MAVPVGELRFAHFGEPGTQLLPGEWTGPTQLMVMEHRSDGSSVFIRPFLDGDEDEDGDREEDMREIPTQKKASNGKHFVEYVVFDKCPTVLLPNTLPINEPSNLEHHVATFRFARRKGDSISIPVLRQYCPEVMQGFHREIGSPSVARSPSGGAGDGIAQQISQLAKAIDTLTLAQTKSFAEQQAMSARVRALERSPSPTAAEHLSAGGTGAGPRRKGVLGAVQPDELSDQDDWAELRDRRPGSDPTSGASRKIGRASAGAGPAAPGNPVGAEINGHIETMCSSMASSLAAMARAKPRADDLDFGIKFKMTGTEGRLRWDALNNEFDADPVKTWKIFESHVTRAMKKKTFSEVSLERFAKHHIPMGDHKTAIRYLSGLLAIYEDLAADRVDHARAQTALLIEATQQFTLDDSWDPAWHITGLGSPGFHEYNKPPKRDAKNASSEDDMHGNCVDNRRYVTARQIKADHKAAIAASN